MNKLFRAPIRTFMAGLLAVLPVALTVAVIIWVASLIDQFVGPQSAIGKVLTSIGLKVVEPRIAAYVIGIVFVLSAVYVLSRDRPKLLPRTTPLPTYEAHPYYP